MAQTLSARIIIAAQVVIVAAITWLLLDLVRLYAGRPALWLAGLAFLFLSGRALFRLRK